MPCYDSRDDPQIGLSVAEAKAAELQAKLNRVTALLCAVCKIHPPIVDHTPGLQEWWTEHEELDRRHEAIAAAVATQTKKMKKS